MNFFFTILFHFKYIIFSDQDSNPLSEVNPRPQNLILTYDEHLFTLIRVVTNDLETTIENENQFCHLIKDFSNLGLFNEIEQGECFNVCESFKTKYFTLKPKFSDNRGEYFEVTELILKTLEELYLVIIKKQEINNLFIDRFKNLINGRESSDLCYAFILISRINKNIVDKTIRFVRVFEYVRNIFE